MVRVDRIHALLQFSLHGAAISTPHVTTLPSCITAANAELSVVQNTLKTVPHSFLLTSRGIFIFIIMFLLFMVKKKKKIIIVPIVVKYDWVERQKISVAKNIFES
jgi:hypothetical protein